MAKIIRKNALIKLYWPPEKREREIGQGQQFTMAMDCAKCKGQKATIYLGNPKSPIGALSEFVTDGELYELFSTSGFGVQGALACLKPEERAFQ